MGDVGRREEISRSILRSQVVLDYLVFALLAHRQTLPPELEQEKLGAGSAGAYLAPELLRVLVEGDLVFEVGENFQKRPSPL